MSAMPAQEWTGGEISPRASLYSTGLDGSQNDTLRRLNAVVAGLESFPVSGAHIESFPPSVTPLEQGIIAERLGNKGIYYFGLLALEGARGGDFATALFSLSYLQTRTDTVAYGVGRFKKVFERPNPEARDLAKQLEGKINDAFPASKEFEKTFQGLQP